MNENPWAPPPGATLLAEVVLWSLLIVCVVGVVICACIIIRAVFPRQEPGDEWWRL